MKIDLSLLPSNMSVVRIKNKTHIMTYAPAGKFDRWPDKALCGCKWDMVDDEIHTTDELSCIRCQKSYEKMFAQK